jgi:hypothetical protein
MATKASPKKAVSETSEAPEARRAYKQRRPMMDLASAIDASGNAIPLDEKGRLTAVPTNWSADYRRFPRTVFADKGMFFEWRILLEGQRIERAQARIEELRELATEARSGADPTKVALRKLQRLAGVAAKLRAQLEAEGVDLSGLLD